MPEGFYWHASVVYAFTEHVELRGMDAVKHVRLSAHDDSKRPEPGHRVLCMAQKEPRDNGVWILSEHAWERPRNEDPLAPGDNIWFDAHVVDDGDRAGCWILGEDGRYRHD